MIASVQGEALAALKCRAYGHRWDDRGWIAMIKESVRGWEQLLICDRCDTERSDFRARGTLKLLGRSYKYRDDYPGSVKHGTALTEIVAHDTQRQADRPSEVA